MSRILQGSQLDWKLEPDGSARWCGWRVDWSHGNYRLFRDGEGFVFSANTPAKIEVFVLAQTATQHEKHRRAAG